jgi:hypothetical protein
MVASAGASTAHIRVPSPLQLRIIILTTAGRNLKSRGGDGCIFIEYGDESYSCCLTTEHVFRVLSQWARKTKQIHFTLDLPSQLDLMI